MDLLLETSWKTLRNDVTLLIEASDQREIKKDVFCCDLM